MLFVVHVCCYIVYFVFFFKQKTAYEMRISDWSSDVCSSDLLSEMGAETIRRAHAVHPIADLQIEYSLISRGIEDDILPTCRELGIAVTAYGVLSRGLISGHWSKEPTGQDYRSHSPRFKGENLERHPALVETGRAHV